MNAQVVSFRCILSDRLGRVISSTFNRDVITGPATAGDLLPELSDRLAGLTIGERRRISLRAEEAYGLYDPELCLEVSRKELKAGGKLRVGDAVSGRRTGSPIRNYRVVAADATYVTLDANHPLAGQDLVFDIEATEARDSVPEDLETPSGPSALKH